MSSATIPICRRARGREASMTTAAPLSMVRNWSTPSRTGQVQRHRLLARVEPIEERRRSASGTIGSPGCFDLHDRCARRRPGAGSTAGRPRATKGRSPSLIPRSRPSRTSWPRRAVTRAVLPVRSRSSRPAAHTEVRATSPGRRAPSPLESPTTDSMSAHGSPSHCVDLEPCRDRRFVVVARQIDDDPVVERPKNTSRASAADGAPPCESERRGPFAEQRQWVDSHRIAQRP